MLFTDSFENEIDTICVFFTNPSIQQWFEYCSSAKKKNCPVCKQICSEASVNRLYFQSVGDQALSQKPTNCEENPGELSWEIEKLEGKILGLRTALEHSQNDVKEIKEEVVYLHYHIFWLFRNLEN